MRVGMGYDVHRLAENRKLIIGGVDIPYEKGLDGHSDADVLLHAIMDALLGAAALGDIGKLFPDTDPEFEGADSMKLLAEVGRRLDEARFIVENIDATIIAQRPKMRPYIDDMRKNIDYHEDVSGEAQELSKNEIYAMKLDKFDGHIQKKLIDIMECKEDGVVLSDVINNYFFTIYPNKSGEWMVRFSDLNVMCCFAASYIYDKIIKIFLSIFL